MKKNRYHSIIAGLMLACAPLIGHTAYATYPNKPINIIVPFAAGGSTDILARMTAEAISSALEQPVIVNNRPGASGNIGMGAVARAEADGYTFLFTSTNLTLNPAVIDNVPYDPVKDFSGVTMLAFAPMLLVTQPDLAGGTLESLIEYGQKNPGRLNFSSSGEGGAPHLAGELFKIHTDIDMTHIPYGGAAPAIADIASGEVEMTFTTYVSARSMLAAERVSALAIASKERLRILPDLPTFEEKGFNDYEVGTMFGLLAPAGTPESAIQIIYDSIKQAASNPDFENKIVELGANLVVNTPSDYDLYLERDVLKWADLMNQLNTTQNN